MTDGGGGVPRSGRPGRVLVGGWFSFAGAGTTVGDIVARDLVCEWLGRAGRPFDVAVDPSFGAGVDWHTVDPDRYTDVVFVCGPFYRSDLLRRFEGCRLIGVNLSMTTPVDRWNPFDLLLERDSSEAARPDITFGAAASAVPVLGLSLVPPEEAKAELRDRYARASDAAARLVRRRGAAAVTIETGLESRSPPASPDAVTSLLSRMDAVVTTRLHGLVLSLRSGVPALAIDPVPGGERVLRQAETIGWPAVVPFERLSDEALDEALDLCLSKDGRRLARACADRAAGDVSAIGESFVRAMTGEGPPDDGRRRRVWVGSERPTVASDGSRRWLTRLRSLLSRGSARSGGR